MAARRDGIHFELAASSSLPPLSQRSTPSIASSSRHPPASAAPSTQPAQSATLARRLLFPHLPAEEPLPRLLASSAHSALEAELYDFIALALRAFVNPWWTKLTRYDKDFLPQITHVTIHAIQVLEERLQSADLSPLVFREIPLILNQHFHDYRAAAAKKGSSYAASGASGTAALFHAQQQHIGITSDGRLDEVYIRTALDIVLKTCFPPEDWAPETERYIVREVVVMVICKSVIPKLTQGWFIQKMVLDLIGQEDASIGSLPGSIVSPQELAQSSAPSMHSFIVLLLSTIQTVSSVGLTVVTVYRQAVQIVKLVNNSPYGREPTPALSPLPVSPSPPSRTHSGVPSIAHASVFSQISSDSSTGSARIPTRPSSVQHSLPPHRNYAFPSLVLLTNIFSLSSRHFSSALMLLLSIVTSFFSPFLDRLLPYMLYKYLFAPSYLASITAIAKRSLFPNGYPAQAPPDPTPEEQFILRSMLVERINKIMPPAAAAALLGPPTARPQSIDALLEPLSNDACNTHLFVLIFDAVLLTLFPEMGMGNVESTDVTQG